jgi:hypothetical protein
MSISDRSAGPMDHWQLESSPGDGLVASGSHHVVVVEVDEDIADSGYADRIVAAFEAHRRLVGRGAARSLRLAISAILAEPDGAAGSLALLSVWDDKLALYLHGEATATLHGRQGATTFSGEGSLVALDVVLPNDVDDVELCVGHRPEGKPMPLDIGDVTTGRAVRVTWPTSQAAGSPLNAWGVRR